MDDVKYMNNFYVGCNTGYKANGVFVKLCLIDRCVYVYTHTQHAQCSRTYFSQISGCPVNLHTPKQQEEEECPSIDHKCLFPFFYPNDKVLKKYKHAIN